MSYNVETTPNFEKEAKRLIKKYTSLKSEIKTLIDSLEENPDKGLHWAMVSTKSGWPLKVKERVNEVVSGL